MAMKEEDGECVGAIADLPATLSEFLPAKKLKTCLSLHVISRSPSTDTHYTSKSLSPFPASIDARLFSKRCTAHGQSTTCNLRLEQKLRHWQQSLRHLTSQVARDGGRVPPGCDAASC